jgi:hypothetical protein
MTAVTAPLDHGRPPNATLVVLPRFPDERSGTGQRSRLLVAAAVRAGPTHVVILEGRAGAQSLPGVESIRWCRETDYRPSRGLSRLVTPARTYRPQPALRRMMLEMVETHRARVVLFRYIRSFCAAGLTCADGLRLIVDVDDRDDQKYQTTLMARLGPRLANSLPVKGLLARLRAVLRRRLRAASHVWFVAREDIWPLTPATTSLLPNVPYWTSSQSRCPPASAGNAILFVGVPDHPPNSAGLTWFLDHCWPSIHAADTRAVLRIVGRGDWTDIAARYADLPGVQIVGEVADLEDEYARARLAICPVREGGGSKIKVIEAAAFGRPVVAVPHAVRGFDGLDALDLPQAADPSHFAQSCLDLLADGTRADAAGRALRDWQAATYSREAFVTSAAAALSSPDILEETVP